MKKITGSWNFSGSGSLSATWDKGTGAALRRSTASMNASMAGTSSGLTSVNFQLPLSSFSAPNGINPGLLCFMQRFR